VPLKAVGKNKFVRVGKSVYLCSRFQKEIVEALYFALAVGKREKLPKKE